MSKPKSKSKKVEKQKLPEFTDRIELRHNFSDAEKVCFLHELSHKNEEKQMLVDQAKSSAKTWKGKIEEVQLAINSLSQKGRDGYEMRPTECRVVYDRKAGKKHIYEKKDGGKLIETRDMTEPDYTRLPLEFPEPKVVPAPGEGLANVGEAIDKAEKEVVNENGSEDEEP